MNTKHLSLASAVLTLAVLLTGCAKKPIEKQQANLELSNVSTNETKAVIDGTVFPQDGHIGLFLFKDEAAVSPYGDTGCSNVEYSYNETDGKWTAGTPIKVGGEPGCLYGYYPYNSSVTDIKSIPVASSLDGDDVMYATKQTVTDETASQTAIRMNHALARITITVVNKGYTLGEGVLSSIKFSGAEASMSGILDATSGIISGTMKADVILDVPSGKQLITAEGTVYECLLVPSEEESLVQTLDLTLNIDGDDKTTILSGDTGVTIARNTKSNITLALSNSGISVQTVSVEDWNVVEVGGHRVTVILSEDDDDIADDVLTSVKVDENTVEILALSLSENRLECVLTGTAEVSREIDKDDDTFTFTISDICSDVTATIGYEEPIKITISLNNPEWGSADFEGEPYKGETITFEATANDGYELSEWQDADGKTLSTENPYSATLTSDPEVEIKAVFKIGGILPGVFTVSKGADGEAGTSDDVKVQFSNGNLYYDSTSDSYHFEDNQYDVIYKYDDFVHHDVETDDHIAHFYWSPYDDIAHSLETYDNPKPTKYDVFFTNDITDKTKPNPEFCANGIQGFWRALSGEEWTYLLNNRDGIRHARAKVHDRVGLLIFPDGYTLPSGYSSDGGMGMSKVNNDTDIYNGFPNYNIPDDADNKIWSEMEAAGVVFLPAAGSRYGNTDHKDSDVLDELTEYIAGRYWSSSLRTDNPYDAFHCFFTSMYVNPSSTTERYHGYSVRLVTDIK